MRPNRPGQLFVEDFEKLSSGTNLVLRAVGRWSLACRFLYLSQDGVWAHVLHGDRHLEFSCFYFGAMPDKDGFWEQDAWVELSEPVIKIRWQEFGF